MQHYVSSRSLVDHQLAGSLQESTTMWARTSQLLLFGCLLMTNGLPTNFDVIESTLNSTNNTSTAKDASPQQGHKDWTYILLVGCLLMIVQICIFWTFNAHGWTTLNETGLCLIFGMVVGAVLKFTASVALQEKVTFSPEIFFYALLPPSIFFAGYDISRRFFFRNIGTIFVFAFVGTVVSFITFAGLIKVFVKMVMPNMFNDFTFHHCLVFGSLISATDPVTVLAIFQDLNVPGDLYSLVFGESCLNDAVAIILYRAVVKYETREFSAGSFFEALATFLGVFIGSIVIGVSTGLLTAFMTKQTKKKHFSLLETSILTLMSYVAYLIAELGGLSGLCCVLFCGISQAHYTYPNLTEESKISTSQGYALLNLLAEKFTFFYMGVSLFTFQNHQWNIQFIAWTFLACAVARCINLYTMTGLMNITWKKKISLSITHMLWFSGFRGPISFGLAFTDTSSRPMQLILTSVCVVGVMTIIVNGSVTTKVMKILRIRNEQKSLESNSGPIEQEKRDVDQEPMVIKKWMQFDRTYMKPFFNRHMDVNESESNDNKTTPDEKILLESVKV